MATALSRLHTLWQVVFCGISAAVCCVIRVQIPATINYELLDTTAVRKATQAAAKSAKPSDSASAGNKWSFWSSKAGRCTHDTGGSRGAVVTLSHLEQLLRLRHAVV